MGVVEVEDMAADAVQEGGIHDVETVAAAQQAGLGRARERGQRGTARSTVSWCEPPTATPIQFSSVRVPSLRTFAGKVLVTGADDVAGQGARHALCGQRVAIGALSSAAPAGIASVGRWRRRSMRRRPP
jgi:hypothetical protein